MYSLQPYIRYASDHTTDMGFRLERMIFDFEIIYVAEGLLRYVEDGVEEICEKGDILLLRPGKNHILEAVDGIIHQPHVHFDFIYQDDSEQVPVSFKKLEELNEEERKQIRTDITMEFPVVLPSVMHIPNAYLIEELLLELIREYDSFNLCKEMMLQARFLLLWGTLCREYHWSQDKKTYKYRVEMEMVKNYLSGHLDREVSLEELSSLVNISKYHLLRLFKTSYGETPGRYQNYLRLARARALLHYTDISVTEISAQLGFGSIHSFSRWFKKQMGSSPRTYRG